MLPTVQATLLFLARTASGTNPILSDRPDLADPSVIQHNNTLFLYHTGDQGSFDVFIADALADVTNASSWRRGPTVFRPASSCILSKIPGLGERSLAWAPHVIFDTDSGRFFMYYSVCLALHVAVSDSPLGPFEEQRRLLRYAIDPFVFEAAGERYLYWASIDLLHDFSGEERLYGQRLATPTTLDATTPPTKLLVPDQPWEFNRSGFYAPAGITEGPWVHVHEGRYYLMYSGASANTAAYRIGYATAASPLGPYTKYEHNPIIQPADPASVGVFGPGSHAVWREPSSGRLLAFYHQQRSNATGWHRFICVDELRISADGVMSLRVTRAQR